MNNAQIKTYTYYSVVLIALIYLFSKNAFTFTNININFSFFISLIFLTAGYLVYPAVLNLVLHSQGIKTKYLISLISLGNTIFSKYIPGKIAMIYAISYKINENNKELSIKRISFNVLLFQIIIIVSGLIFGVLSAFYIPIYSTRIIIFAVVFVIISIFLLLSKRIYKLLSIILSKILKKKISLETVSKQQLAVCLFISFIFWMLWGLGFYFFIDSLEMNIVGQFCCIFLFPFSICIGIILIIAPGGIGVREGVLTGFLVAAGNNVATAAELSILSRIWFVIGEIIIFSISILISYINKRKLKAKK